MKKFYIILVALFLVNGAMGQSDPSCVPCLPEGINFTTQEQIDQFHQNYPGCWQVGGDVTISSGNGIVNLLGLYGLYSIGGNLNITGNNVLVNFSGLNSLHSIGGFLRIENNSALTSLLGLENIYDGTITTLTIAGNPSLSACEVHSICDYLSSPNGIVDIYSNAAGCNSSGEVVSTCGGSMPCLPYGNYYFLTQSDIDNFQTYYPGCTQLEGNVTISGNDINNCNGLSGVTSIEGNLTIHDNHILTTLAGLDSLTVVGGSVSITDNGSLTSLTGLNALTFIGGDLNIGYCNTGWGGLYCFGNASLTSLTGLGNLISVGGTITIVDNPSLTSLTGLQGLTSTGNLNIGLFSASCNYRSWVGNASLINLTGLDSLTSVTGSVNITGNSSLTSLTGFNALTSIEGGLTIGYNDTLINLTGLDNLVSIGWTQGWVIYPGLIIHNNNALTSLIGIEKLTSIEGDLRIGTFCGLCNEPYGGNESLTSITGLESLTSIGGFLEISLNPVLSSCAIQIICDYLSNSYATIYSNAPGCNSVGEVMDSCGITSVESLTDGGAFSLFPNPTSTTITVETPDQGYLFILNLSGQPLLQQTITEPTTTIDISNLPSGVYIVKVASENGVQVGKIIKQ